MSSHEGIEIRLVTPSFLASFGSSSGSSTLSVRTATKRGGVGAEGEVGEGLDEAGPVEPGVHEERGADGVDVIERGAPVEALEVVAGGGVVVDGFAEAVAAGADAEVVAGGEEELVAVGEIDV